MSPETIIVYLTYLGREPMLLAVAILVSTFVLEDAATVGAAMLAADGALPVSWAMSALFAGIVLGDIGLYGLGRLASRNPWVLRQLQKRVAVDLRDWVDKRLVPLVLGARFVPGARLPSYTASGMLRLPFWRFTVIVAMATFLWTSLIFSLIFAFGHYYHERLGLWRWPVAGLVVLALLVFPRAWHRYRTGSQ